MLQTRNDLESPSVPDAQFERLNDLIHSARQAGADAAEAVFVQSRALSIGVRKGEIETVERDENTDLGLRVFVGRKQSVVSVSEFSKPTLERLVERAVIMAGLAPDDPYASLADPACCTARPRQHRICNCSTPVRCRPKPWRSAPWISKPAV